MGKVNEAQWTNENAVIRRMHEEGKTAREIAEALGKTNRTVQNRLAKMGLSGLRDVICQRCGKVIPKASPMTKYCGECRRAAAREYARRHTKEISIQLVCKQCGKEFTAPANRLYCCHACYRAARKSGGYARTGTGAEKCRIDVEIYIGGKMTSRMENVGWFEAREVWHRGWLGGGYAAVVYKNGAKPDTIPKVARFFKYGGDAL